MLKPEEQVAFLKSVDEVRQVAERHLETHRSPQSAIAFVSSLQHKASSIIQRAVGQGVEIACKAGCNHCCRARVEAMAAEIFRIARELRGRPAEEMNHVIRRLETHLAMRSDEQAWSRRPQCPFLENELCSIYDVRPGVCRKAHSLDLRKCRTDAAEIPQNLGIVVGIAALTQGTADAYRKLGLDAASHELGQGVLLALSDPTTESRWYDGEAVFVQDVAAAHPRSET